MRKASLELDQVIKKVHDLKGEHCLIEVNRGRKKIDKYIAIIEKIYPSVFTVLIKEPENKGIQSFSFSDVLCGDVVFKQYQKHTNVENESLKKQV